LAKLSLVRLCLLGQFALVSVRLDVQFSVRFLKADAREVAGDVAADRRGDSRGGSDEGDDDSRIHREQDPRRRSAYLFSSLDKGAVTS
jgi:hypothetical protein